MHSRGFPNCFIISLAQSGFTVNFPHMLNEQARHIAYIVRHALDHDVRARRDRRRRPRTAWVETILELAQNNQQFLEACTPGYYNNEGRPGERSQRNGFYGAGPIAFVKLLEDWRADGEPRRAGAHAVNARRLKRRSAVEPVQTDHDQTLMSVARSTIAPPSSTS